MGKMECEISTVAVQREADFRQRRQSRLSAGYRSSLEGGRKQDFLNPDKNCGSLFTKRIWQKCANTEKEKIEVHVILVFALLGVLPRIFA